MTPWSGLLAWSGIGMGNEGEDIKMLELLSVRTVVGIELWRVVMFFAVILLSLIVGRMARFFMRRADGSGKEEARVVLLKAMSRPVVLVAFVIGWRLGAISLAGMSEKVLDIVDTISRVLTAGAIGYGIYGLVDVVDFWLRRWAEKTQSKVDDMLVPLVGKSVRITVLLLVVLDVVQTISTRPVASIIAGLGVGGLAIALAGQDTIKNFFGSLVIVADRPFEIGDRIIVDGHDGPVVNVGFRSTRIQTLDGHLVTVPNSEMVNKT